MDSQNFFFSPYTKSPLGFLGIKDKMRSNTGFISIPSLFVRQYAQTERVVFVHSVKYMKHHKKTVAFYELMIYHMFVLKNERKNLTSHRVACKNVSKRLQFNIHSMIVSI